MKLSDLQREQVAWLKHNFPNFDSWEPLVGAMEELGELSHAHLKKHQGIRTNEDHDSDARDAVGDIVIYLSAYCSARGFDFGSAVADAWGKVQKRDWVRFPSSGGNPDL